LPRDHQLTQVNGSPGKSQPLHALAAGLFRGNADDRLHVGYTAAMPGIRKKLAGVASAVLRPDNLLGAGSEAPEFDLRAHDGADVQSETLKGKHHYVLVFYPGDDTPGCTLQLQAFSRALDSFEQEDCLIFGVNPASESSHQRFCDKADLSVPLLVDVDRKLAIAYRTARPGVPRTFRAVFVIDKKGIVRSAMKDMPDVDAVLQVVRRSNETGYKGTGRRGRQLVPEVSGYGIRKIIENNTDTQVLDIRERVDWLAGHIPGALNIPIDSLADQLSDLPGKRTPLIIACDQGLRATGAARILWDAGYRKLYTLIDGMEAYRGELEEGEESVG